MFRFKHEDEQTNDMLDVFTVFFSSFSLSSLQMHAIFANFSIAKTKNSNGGMIMCVHIKPNANGKHRIISKVRIPDMPSPSECSKRDRVCGCGMCCGCNVQNVLEHFVAYLLFARFHEATGTMCVCVCV